MTVDESWIYAYEPESKQQSTTVWVLQDEPNLTKVARLGNTSTEMISCFFERSGHVAIVQLEQDRTINSEWYTTTYLPVVFQEIRKTNRRRRITLHHDNVSSHTSAQTTAYVKKREVNVFRHLK